MYIPVADAVIKNLGGLFNLAIVFERIRFVFTLDEIKLFLFLKKGLRDAIFSPHKFIITS